MTALPSLNVVRRAEYERTPLDSAEQGGCCTLLLYSERLITRSPVKQSREIMAQPSMARHVKKEHLAGQSTLHTKDD